jgi:predicted nucleic acid-binding protein
MSHYWRIDRLPSLKNKKILFDANIWIYIFCEIGEFRKYYVDKYSKAFFILLKTPNTIYTDLIVISEFIIRYLMISFENYIKRENLLTFDYKKDYRKTSDFEEAWTSVCDIVSMKILSKSLIINSDYNQTSIKKLLRKDQFETDFNDKHIINLCEIENMFLMTNDADFKNTDLNIITENEAYWRN